MKYLIYRQSALITAMLLGSIQILVAQQVYHPPRIVPTIAGQFEVGVEAQGKVTETFTSIQDFQSQYQQTNTFNNSFGQSSSFINETTDQFNASSHPNPAPKAGDFFSSMVNAVTSGDISGLVNNFASAINYATQPVANDWSRSYSNKSTTSSSQNQASTTQQNLNSVKTWVNHVTQQMEASKVYDLNAGYLKCGFRLVNTGTTGIYIKSPVFAIYLQQLDGSAYQVGIGTAMALAGSDAPVYLGSHGGTRDFQFALKQLDFQTLVTRYAAANGVSFRMQSLQVSDKEQGPFADLSDIVDQQSTQGVQTRVVSDSYDIAAFVPDSSSALKLKDVLTSLHLPNDLTADQSVSATFALTRINVDANALADRRLSELSGNEQLQWRRWSIVLVDDNGVPVKDFKVGDDLLPGFRVAFIELKAADVLGRSFRPVVFSKKQVTIVSNIPWSLDDFTLKPGDRIVFSNPSITHYFADTVSYALSDATPRYLSTPVYPPVIRPTLATHLLEYDVQGVDRTEITNLSDFFNVPKIANLPGGVTVETLFRSFGGAGILHDSLTAHSNGLTIRAAEEDAPEPKSVSDLTVPPIEFAVVSTTSAPGEKMLVKAIPNSIRSYFQWDLTGTAPISNPVIHKLKSVGNQPVFASLSFGTPAVPGPAYAYAPPNPYVAWQPMQFMQSAVLSEDCNIGNQNLGTPGIVPVPFSSFVCVPQGPLQQALHLSSTTYIGNQQFITINADVDVIRRQ